MDSLKPAGLPAPAARTLDAPAAALEGGALPDAKVDSVELSLHGPPDNPVIPMPGPRINKLEKAERYTNNVLVHLMGSDTPALLSIWANLGSLPGCLAPVLGAFNLLNTGTGIASIVLDTRETIATCTNKKATKLDKIMDVGHLLGGDVVSTLASMVPMVASLANPLAMGFFVGGQLLGLALDGVKTIYDVKREGQQSAH